MKLACETKFFQNSIMVGRLRHFQRIMGEANKRGFGMLPTIKISAPALCRKRRFCGSVATLPMLALVWFSWNGKEGGVRFCSKIWKSMVEGEKPPTDRKLQRYQQLEADRPDGGILWAEGKNWSIIPLYHNIRSRPLPVAFYLTFWLSMRARRGRESLQRGRINIW